MDPESYREGAPGIETIDASFEHTPGEIRDALRRITGSRWFREARQLQAFLKFIIEETLAGRQDALKESLIGCAVFGRRPDYDPRRETIVRVQATMLRKKLQAYYKDEGAADPIIIEVPRGGYVPVFSKRAPATLAAPSEIPHSEAPASFRMWIAFAAGCLSVALMWAGISVLRNSAARSVRAAGVSDFPELWRPFLEPGARTIVAFGVPLFYADKGVFLRDVQVNSPGQPSEERVAAAGQKLGLRFQPTDDVYTGVGEAAGTQLLSDFLSRQGVAVTAANARTVPLSELRNGNVIVISSLRFRTLLSDLHLPCDFEFLPAGAKIESDRIVNRRPHPGERRDYEFTVGNGVSTSYAVVGVWPGLNPRNRIVHIGGVHTWATQAATEYLLRPREMRRLAERFTQDREAGGRGSVSPYFQVLLRVEARGNKFQTVDYVTHHYLQVTEPPARP
jgi:hypothetical protein